MVGTSVARYRPVHFQHHRALGSKNDSEFTYFYPLSFVFLLKAAFGIRALEVMLHRAKMPGAQAKKSGSLVSVTLVAGAAVHLGIIVGSIVAGVWWSALAWGAGVCLVFPFFAALRQSLEHRSDHARADVDYRTQDHGAFTRLFGEGLFASSFGGAGFNRHLLTTGSRKSLIQISPNSNCFSRRPRSRPSWIAELPGLRRAFGG